MRHVPENDKKLIDPWAGLPYIKNKACAEAGPTETCKEISPMKMKSMALTALFLLAAIPIMAQEPAAGSSEAEKGAVIKTALDYSDGAYSGDAARMERAIHPDLNKLIFNRRSPAMGLAAGYSTYGVLVEAVRAGLIASLDSDKRLTEVSVLEVKDDAACVKLRTAQWCDYLQMIKA